MPKFEKAFFHMDGYCFSDNKELEDTPEPQETEDFVIPEKYKHVDLNKLFKSERKAEEISCLIKKIPIHSTLYYGLKASDTILHFIRSTIPENYGKGVEIQVLSPLIHGSLGTDSLNALIQNSLNPYKKGKVR